MSNTYKAIVSSDWSECLSPSGPFDCLSSNFPQLTHKLTTIFRQYTGNRISLGEAAGRIRQLVPDLINRKQMDAYLNESYATYKGVPDLIEWCLSKNILFMINTTGMIGYFQRVFAKGLLPPMPVLSANPLIRYPADKSDPPHIYELCEIRDKGRNTEAVVHQLGIPPEKIILIGDSGGDGPHFQWGADKKAFLIGSMTKPSLDNYCRANNVAINLRFGLGYAGGQKRDLQREMQVNFMDLTTMIEEIADS